jgi:hypothetical protein
MGREEERQEKTRERRKESEGVHVLGIYTVRDAER